MGRPLILLPYHACSAGLYTNPWSLSVASIFASSQTGSLLRLGIILSIGPESPLEPVVGTSGCANKWRRQCEFMFT